MNSKSREMTKAKCEASESLVFKCLPGRVLLFSL